MMAPTCHPSARPRTLLLDTRSSCCCWVVCRGMHLLLQKCQQLLLWVHLAAAALCSCCCGSTCCHNTKLWTAITANGILLFHSTVCSVPGPRRAPTPPETHSISHELSLVCMQVPLFMQNPSSCSTRIHTTLTYTLPVSVILQLLKMGQACRHIEGKVPSTCPTLSLVVAACRL